MKKLLILTLSSVLFLSAFAQQKFGGAVNKTQVYKVAELKELLKDSVEINNVTLMGNIQEVCKAKGCWMTMDVAGEKMTVKFKDYGFFMPLDSDGKFVTFTGKAFIKEISVAELKHLAQDAGKSKKEIKKIKKPRKEYRFEAAGVEML